LRSKNVASWSGIPGRDAWSLSSGQSGTNSLARLISGSRSGTGKWASCSHTAFSHLIVSWMSGVALFGVAFPVIEYLDEGNYTGIDVREIAIDEARKELASYPQFAAKSPRLLLSTGFDTLPDLGPIDRAWSFSVLIHMEDEFSAGCLLYLGHALRAGGLYHSNAIVGHDHNPDSAKRVSQS
jgi:hypothetical protein